MFIPFLFFTGYAFACALFINSVGMEQS